MSHDEQLPIDAPTWSLWMLPEAELGVLGPYEGRDVVELGSGAAQFSISLARGGARCTALDISSEQLALAEGMLDHVELQVGTRPDVQLVQGNAEQVDLPDASFDIAFSDYVCVDVRRPAAVGAGGRATAAPRWSARVQRDQPAARGLLAARARHLRGRPHAQGLLRAAPHR